MVVVGVYSNSEVLVMEYGVAVFCYILCWDGVVLLLNVYVNGWVLNDEWNLLFNCVLFQFVDGEFTDVGYFVWNLNLGSVWDLVFNYIWFVNCNSEEGLVPLGDGEFLLNVVCLLLVLGNWNLLTLDVWHLLDDSVVNSLGDFIGHIEFFCEGNLVIDSVWYLLSGDEWDLVVYSLGHLSAGHVGDLELDFEWHLPVDGVRHFG